MRSSLRQFENHVVVPKVIQRQGRRQGAVVIVTLLIGDTLLGIVGAILAVTIGTMNGVFARLW